MDLTWRIICSPRILWELLRDTGVSWNNDMSQRRGAALAFYTVFSLAPILIIAIAIAGMFFGKAAVQGEIVQQVSDLIGPDGARAVQTMIQHAARPGAGIAATLFGIGTLILGATTALAELKDDLDQIWGAPPAKSGGLLSNIWQFIRKRLLSVGMIFALGFLLLVSLVLSAVLVALTHFWIVTDTTSVLLQLINFAFSFGLISALFATIYKVLPAVRIDWRDVIIGAVVTALLFNIGKSLIGIYIGNSAIASSYGAASSVILVLVWVYYSAQIFFFGAEFTKVYAYRFGSHRGRVHG